MKRAVIKEIAGGNLINPNGKGVIKVGESKSFFGVSYSQLNKDGKIDADLRACFNSEQEAKNFAENMAAGKFGKGYGLDSADEIGLVEFHRVSDNICCRLKRDGKLFLDMRVN